MMDGFISNRGIYQGMSISDYEISMGLPNVSLTPCQYNISSDMFNDLNMNLRFIYVYLI